MNHLLYIHEDKKYTHLQVYILLDIYIVNIFVWRNCALLMTTLKQKIHTYTHKHAWTTKNIAWNRLKRNVAFVFAYIHSWEGDIDMTMNACLLASPSPLWHDGRGPYCVCWAGRLCVCVVQCKQWRTVKDSASSTRRIVEALSAGALMQ